MARRTVDMTAGSPAGHIPGLSLPLILTNMGQQLYMIADGALPYPLCPFGTSPFSLLC